MKLTVSNTLSIALHCELAFIDMSKAYICNKQQSQQSLQMQLVMGEYFSNI